MTTIRFRGQSYDALDGESVLDCLLRHGVETKSSCRAGACQTCISRATGGAVPARAQAGLNQALRARGCFLPCVCPAADGLEIEPVDAFAIHHATIDAVEDLAAGVFRLWLRVDGELRHSAGQFLQLVRTDDGLVRPYSIASLPTSERIELHVAERPGGRMSPWLRSATGKTLELRGPAGECVYVEGRPDEPLVLAGTGTGLAPLLGVVRAALAAGHRGPIRLYHGSPRASGLYLHRELERLAEAHPNLTYVASALESDVPNVAVRTTPIARALGEDVPRLGGWRVYLCGNPDFVRSLRKTAFLAGAAMADIHSDPFVSAA